MVGKYSTFQVPTKKGQRKSSRNYYFCINIYCIKEEFDDFSWEKVTIEDEIKEKLTANNVKWLETLGIDSSSY